MLHNACLDIVFICSILVNLIEGDNYYLGGTLTYRAWNSSRSVTWILINQTYLFNSSEVYCDQTMIDQRTPPLMINSLLNPSSNRSRYRDQFERLKSASNTLTCIDYSSELGITVGQQSNTISMTDVLHFPVVLSSGSWRQLSLPMHLDGDAFWHVISSITLRMRSNGRYNNPPVTKISSPIRVPVNILHVIHIPVADADRDQIRCRFANDRDECSDVCYPTSLPNNTELFPNCQLQITGENIGDWYGVTIMVRNFSFYDLSISLLFFLLKYSD